MAMPPFLSKIVNSPNVRRAFVALIVAALAALGISLQGCSQHRINQPKLDVLECQLDAVSDLLGSAEAAEAVVMAAKVGDYGRAVRLIVELGVDVKAVAEAFDACDGEPAAPPADAGPAEILQVSWEA
jgi:hypothetical protein